MTWLKGPNIRMILSVLVALVIISASVSCTSGTAQTPNMTLPPTTPASSATVTGSPSPVVTTTPANSPTLTSTPTVSPSPTSAGTAPPEVTQYINDWPLPGKDYANTRTTTNSTINSSNVNTLGAAWIHNVPSGQSTFGSISTTPIIMGNTVYIQDIGNNVFALDLATGALKWQTVYNLSNLGPNGASVGYGKVFMSAGPYDVAALDANTGKELWRTTLIDITKDPTQGVNGIDMQTTVYDGMVYVSTVPGNAGVFYAGGGMGILYALDQNTGKVVWSFNTVYPTDWITNNPGINSGGGAWYPPAIDTATGQMYWGIANPAPFPGQPKTSTIPQDWPNASSRPGPNLYTNSLMAMNHTTGAMTWYNQVWPHDTSDYDLMIPPILGNADYGGKKQDIVIGAGKMGQVYAFNRQTGALLWKVAVGEHNGNDLLAGYPTDGTVTVLPGILGGVETPMAYADGVVYVLANNLAVDYTNGLTLKLHPFSENTSNMEAIDVNTGKVLWNVPLPAGGYGGATVVNDLVFTGTFDSMLYAFDRKTGKQVWSYQAPAGVNAWPAVAGDTIVWPIAGAGIPSVLAFKLGSTNPTVKIVTPADKGNVAAGDITVTAEPTNIKMVDKIGQANAAGEGHLIYYLDVDAPTAAGQPATTSTGTYNATKDTNYTWKNVAAGSHTLSVQLVNNDNTPLNPPVVQKITITADTNPRITISAPNNGSIHRAGSITITVNVTNFDLGGGASPSPSAGAQGKLVYYMDVQPPTAAGQPATPTSGTFNVTNATSFTFTNVPVGIHTFYVQLVDNNNMPLGQPVIAKVQIFTIQYTGGLGGQ